MDDFGESVPFVRAHEHVNVVRHDAPLEEAVTTAVEVKECPHDELRDVWV